MGTKVDVASADIFMVKVKTEIIYQRGYKAKPASWKGYADDPLLRYYTIKIVITKGKGSTACQLSASTHISSKLPNVSTFQLIFGLQLQFALLSDFPSFAFFNSPFCCFCLFKHQNHVATPEKPKIIGKMANVHTAIVKRSPPVTTYFACVFIYIYIFCFYQLRRLFTQCARADRYLRP